MATFLKSSFIIILVTTAASVASICGCGPTGINSPPSSEGNRSYPSVQHDRRAAPAATSTLSQSGEQSFATEGSRPPAGGAADFFPSRPGTSWKYSVRVNNEIDPLDYEETVWPMPGDHSVVYASRKRLFARDRLGPGGNVRDYFLEVSVKGKAETQGPLKYPNGVELQIKQDDLGIFEDTKAVFWSVSGPGAGRFHVVLVKTYPSHRAPTGGQWGGWGQGDGHSARWLFFADRPMTGISRPKSPEELVFLGLDDVEVENSRKECLHFTRRVSESQESDESSDPRGSSELDRSFQEDYWFARGLGLVRLVQSIDDHQTMVWTLNSFNGEIVSVGSPQ